MIAVPNDTFNIDANTLLDPRGRSVESAMRLAGAIVGSLAAVPVVRVSLATLSGASSSYFNTLFLALAGGKHLDDVGRSIVFEFASSAQREVFDRSLGAVRSSLSRS